MNTIIARTLIGGRDLFMGCPNVEGAIVSSVTTDETTDDYCTSMVLNLVNGSKMKIIIKQEIE